MCKRKLNDGQKPRRQRRKKIVNGKWYLTNSITFPLASVPPRLLVSFLSFAFLSALVNVGQTELFLLFSPFIIIIDKIKPATEPYAKLISCAHFWVGTPFLCAFIFIYFFCSAQNKRCALLVWYGAQSTMELNRVYDFSISWCQDKIIMIVKLLMML